MLATVSIAVASGGAAPAGAQEPGCFGALVSMNAHQPTSGAPNLGQFVSPLAQTVRPFGQIELPFFKVEPRLQLVPSPAIHADLATAAALAAPDQQRTAALVEIGLGERECFFRRASRRATG
jgi:hypothetical protein